MKKIKSKMLKKVLPIFLLFVLIFNFIMPNYVYATSPSAGGVIGGVLFSPIKFLLCAVGDAVMLILQNTFVTYGTPISLDGYYEIRYSPGIIFQGDVPGLDINFLDPMKPKEQMQYGNQWQEVDDFTTTSIFRSTSCMGEI